MFFASTMQPHPALSVLIAIVITVLTASFLFSVGYAVFEEPSYDDYCGSILPYPDRFENMTAEEREEHNRQWRECDEAYTAARERNGAGVFFTVTVLSIFVIIGALAMRPSEVNLTFYIVAGVVFGAVVAILMATGNQWQWFGRFLRPVVLLTEIVLVIFVAYRLFAPNVSKGSHAQKKRVRAKK